MLTTSGAVPLSVSPKPTLFSCRVDAAHEIGSRKCRIHQQISSAQLQGQRFSSGTVLKSTFVYNPYEDAISGPEGCELPVSTFSTKWEEFKFYKLRLLLKIVNYANIGGKSGSHL